jgi:hypothetical protein
MDRVILTSGSVLSANNFLDTALTREVILGSIEHFSKAQAQTLVNVRSDTVFAVDQSRPGYVLVASWKVRLNRTEDGRPFSVYCEISGYNGEEPDSTNTIVVTLTPGWETPSSPNSVEDSAREEIVIPDHQTYLLQSVGILTMSDVAYRKVNGVRRAVGDDKIYSTEVCAATISVFAASDAASSFGMTGFYAREIYR